MKNARNLLLVTGLLAVPATGSAQEPTRYSIGIGLASRTQTVYRPGIGVGLAHQSGPEPALFGPGAFAHGSSPAPGQGYHDDHYGHGHHDGWSPYDCWDHLWQPRWCGCNRYVLVGYWSFGWWDAYHPWWGFGFLGWAPPRYSRYHWYAYGPFWYSYRDWWYPRHYGAGWSHPRRYAYHGRGGGYVGPRGYGSAGKAKARGHSGDRIVRGSPLFGPSYKEDPRARASDNGRDRPVSRAAPRGSRADAGGAVGRSRPGETSKARRARPRGETKLVTTRSIPPKLRTRTDSPPGTRATPTRVPGPKVRPARSGRPTPTATRAPTRRATPKARPTAASTRRRPPSRPLPSSRRRRSVWQWRAARRCRSPGRPRARPRPSR